MRVTGSRVHRAWKCPASVVLPQVERDRPELEPARDKGRSIHAFLETVKAKGKAPALADAPAELLPLLEALDLENLPVHLATEVSFAWNWRTSAARELGRSLPRNASGGVDYDSVGVDWSAEIPCTLDVVGVEAQVGHGGVTRGYVGDYKSGHGKYPPPDMYGQTLLGAACVRSVYSCDDGVVVELIHIHDTGTHHCVRRQLNDWDLDAFEGELAEAMRSVSDPIEVEGVEEWLEGRGPDPFEKHRPAPVEGPWCEYCDAFRSCPKKLALVREIPERLLQIGIRPGMLAKDGVEQPALVIDPGALAARNAAAAWMALEAIEDVIGRARSEICAIAAHGEIQLPDGRVIGYTDGQERREVNGRIAAEVLEKRYGRSTRDEVVELSVTIGALRLAAQKHLQAGEKLEKRDGTGALDRVLDEIDRLGGVTKKTVGAGVRPHVPKKKRLPG